MRKMNGVNIDSQKIKMLLAKDDKYKKELAIYCKMNPNSVWRMLESGRTDLDNAYKIAEFLNVDISEIAFRVEPRDLMGEREMKKELDEIMNELKAKEREIVRLRYELEEKDREAIRLNHDIIRMSSQLRSIAGGDISDTNLIP
jgi:DNA-directed RNA polymerase sigma subunit (sigma70/sigma32)